MKTIIISMSYFGNPVSDFYKSIAEYFVKDKYKVIFIFDGLVNNLPNSSDKIEFYSWRSNRPTKLKDFIFFYKLVKRVKPVLCISNFGSHNIVTIVSYMLGVKNRIDYIHTASKAIQIDNTRNSFITKILIYRKKYINRLNTHFFTNSNGNKLDFAKINNITENKITVLPLLIEDSVIPLKMFSEREFSICVVGRLHPSKNHKNLLKCVKLAIIKYPMLRLKVAGVGYLLKELTELSEKLNILNNIEFLGNLNRKEISCLFSSSLISISSSIDDAFGLVNIEALREGTPLICTKTSGSLDILQNEINGVFFDSENGVTFLSAIDEILSNYEFYSKNARQIFTENYSLSNSFKSYEAIKNFV